VRRGASAAEHCGPVLWPNVLSVVRKSRNSSGGLYRCRRRSPHDRRRTNAMRFLMNTLLAHPIPPLMDALRQNPLWIRSGSRRCLRLLCEDPLSPSELAGVRQLQLSTFCRQFNPASQSCWHAKIRIQNRSLPCLRLLAHGTFPRRSWQRQG
jgi:hypothetical protein